MRLSDILSKPPTHDFKQIEGFLSGKNLPAGKQRKIQVGKIALNYFCKNCMDTRTFCSGEEIYCIGVNDHLVSIDCVLKCHCNTSVQIWFLVYCEGDISDSAPEVCILKRSVKLPTNVQFDKKLYGEFSDLLEKAQLAQLDSLGAGSMVYLRKIFEQITLQTATASGIECKLNNGRKKPFKILLEEVDRQCSIIPREFSANRYRLFGELSDIVHGDYNEELALSKFGSLHRLIIGILDNIKNNSELKNAIESLGWINEGDNCE